MQKIYKITWIVVRIVITVFFTFLFKFSLDVCETGMAKFTFGFILFVVVGLCWSRKR